jgi:hypothetical protein
VVAASDTPVVFTKPGTYELPDKKQKTAFGQGTIYFRHGSKSEHGNRNDLANWRDREITKARRSWLGGIRKVVETNPDETVTVISSSLMSPKYSSMVQAAISSDPSAIKFAPTNAGDIWPHRQIDVIREVNKKLGNGVTINSHDILCIKNKYDVMKAHPEFAYKPHKLASPQYSDAFVEWLLAEYKKNKNFFQKAREDHKPKKTSG